MVEKIVFMSAVVRLMAPGRNDLRSGAEVTVPLYRHPWGGEGTSTHQQRGRSENSEHDVGKVDLQNGPRCHQGELALHFPGCTLGN